MSCAQLLVLNMFLLMTIRSEASVTVYVSSESGSDDSAGTSALTALKTLPYGLATCLKLQCHLLLLGAAFRLNSTALE